MRRQYSKAELVEIWDEANYKLGNLLLAVAGFPLDGEGRTKGIDLWLENFDRLAPTECFIFNLMTIPLGVYAPDWSNLPRVGAWAWDMDGFRDLLEVCISGLVHDEDDRGRWKDRLERILSE